MSLASFRQSLLLNVLTSYSHRPRDKHIRPVNPISCKQPLDDTQDSSRQNENRVAKLAMVALAAGVMTLGSVDDAFAAKTGGRVGGQAFKSSAPRARVTIRGQISTSIHLSRLLQLADMGMVTASHIMEAGVGCHFRSSLLDLVLPSVSGEDLKLWHCLCFSAWLRLL